jgi:hypothetical protein
MLHKSKVAKPGIRLLFIRCAEVLCPTLAGLRRTQQDELLGLQLSHLLQ